MSGTTSRRLAGISSITIDGDAWDAVSALEYSPTTVSRETLRGLTGVEGYSEMPQQGSIKVTLRDRSDEAVYSLNKKTNATIVVQLANGKTVFGSGLWQTGEISVTAQEGTFEVSFEGPSVVESTI